MLNNILIESKAAGHHLAYEVKHNGQRATVFEWVGDLESLEKRVRWEYRKRISRGLEVKVVPKAH